MNAGTVVVANDDGVGAPGLALLAEVAAQAGLGRVVGVGPEKKWTAASHHVSFDRDLVLTRLAADRYACSGTPVDGLIALCALLVREGAAPGLVLAGVNDKRNVGEDSAYSGTMAIAREAAMRGLPAIALSHERKDAYAPDERAWLARLLATLVAARAAWMAEGGFVVVNLPSKLPAPLAFPRLARDKIAQACELVSQDGARSVLRLVRGRPGTRAAGDENDALARGELAIVRHRWNGALPVDTALAAAWQQAMRGAAA